MDGCTQVTLPFLGSRSYLQGTTLFDRVSEEVEDGTNIVYKINNFFLTDTVQMSEKLDLLSFPPIASMAWVTPAGVSRTIYVAPLAPSVLPFREVFDEDRIVSSAIFKDDSAIGNVLCGESPIRTLVSLTKALLLKLLDTHALEGQWLFTRLDLGKMLAATGSISIIFASKHSLSLVCCTVRQAGVVMGKIYFSWVSKPLSPEI